MEKSPGLFKTIAFIVSTPLSSEGQNPRDTTDNTESHNQTDDLNRRPALLEQPVGFPP